MRQRDTLDRSYSHVPTYVNVWPWWGDAKNKMIIIVKKRESPKKKRQKGFLPSILLLLLLLPFQCARARCFVSIFKDNKIKYKSPPLHRHSVVQEKQRLHYRFDSSSASGVTTTFCAPMPSSCHGSICPSPPDLVSIKSHLISHINQDKH